MVDKRFKKELNNTDDGIKIKITGKIEPFHHQDYDGKRVYIQLTNKNKRLSSILNNSKFKSRINTANNNWLEMQVADVIESVLNYFEGLTVVASSIIQ